MNAICSIISIMWSAASGMAAFPIWHSSAAMCRTKATAICWRQSCRALSARTSALIWTVQRLLSRRATAARAEKRTKTATICAGSASSARSAAASTFRAWIRNTSAPHMDAVQRKQCAVRESAAGRFTGPQRAPRPDIPAPRSACPDGTQGRWQHPAVPIGRTEARRPSPFRHRTKRTAGFRPGGGP